MSEAIEEYILATAKPQHCSACDKPLGLGVSLILGMERYHNHCVPSLAVVRSDWRIAVEHLRYANDLLAAIRKIAAERPDDQFAAKIVYMIGPCREQSYRIDEGWKQPLQTVPAGD